MSPGSISSSGFTPFQCHPRASLLGLSLELRIKIYEQLFYSAQIIRASKRLFLPAKSCTHYGWCERHRCSRPSPSEREKNGEEPVATGVSVTRGAELLFSCRQIYAEAQPIFLQWATFRFDSSLARAEVPSHLGWAVANMRQVHILSEGKKMATLTRSRNGDHYVDFDAALARGYSRNTKSRDPVDVLFWVSMHFDTDRMANDF